MPRSLITLLYKSKTILIFFGLFLLFIIYQKIRLDNQNKSVDICVDYSSIQEFCLKNNKENINEILESLKNIGISSYAIKETILQDYCRQSHITVLPNCWPLSALDRKIAGNDLKLVISEDIDSLKRLAELIKEKNDIDVTIQETTDKNKKIYYFSLAEKAFQENISLGIFDIPDFLEKNNSRIYLRPVNSRFADSNNSGVFLDNIFNRNNLCGIIFGEDEIWGYPDKMQPLVNKIKEKRIKVGSIEFQKQKGFETLAASVSKNIFLIHSISEAEGDKLALSLGSDELKNNIISRYLRAVNERNVRLLYYRFINLPGADFSGSRENVIEWNVNVISALQKKILQQGYKTGELKTYSDFKMFLLFDVKLNKLRQAVAFIFSVLIPVLVLYAGHRCFKMNYFYITLFALLLSIALYFLMANYYFFIKLQTFRGIKLSFAVSFILVCVYLFKREMNDIFCEPLKMYHLLIFVIFGAAFFVILSRTGNETSLAAGVLEIKARNLLEDIFLIRPRFKEFLFGHPLLFTGAYLERKRLTVLGIKNQYFLLLGAVGIISMVNTFCHLHTPLIYSILRTVYGIFIGCFIGWCMVRSLMLLRPGLFKLSKAT